MDKQDSPVKPNSLNRQLPKVTQSFFQFHDAVMANGALSEKTKELIAVGISVSIRCSACIQRHVTLAFQLGNSPAEIAEAASVGLMMGGGPALNYATEATALLDSLTKDKKEQKTL
jgi:AhpD family alkylhydroperoxidase